MWPACVVITHLLKDCSSLTNGTTPLTTTAATTSCGDCGSPGSSSCDTVNASTSSSEAFVVSSAEEYFYKAVADISTGLGDTGHIRWQLMLCLLFCWVIVGLSLAKSSKPGGKMTYLIVFLPVSLLLVLLVRWSSLPGAKQGLRHLFTPDLSRLTQGHVWRDAASQVFFSLSLGSGALVALSTYNKFNNHVFREACLVCLADTCLSVLVSLLVFAVIGAVSHQTGLPLSTALKPDIGLPFVVLSHAVHELPWSLLWAVLVFVALVLCGVTTLSSITGVVVAAVTERSRLKKQRLLVVLAVITAGFLIGASCTVQSGFYTVEVFDLHLSGLPQLTVGGATLIAFAWIYGSSRLASDIARMVKRPVGWWWRLLWVGISPGVVAACIVMSLTSLVTYRDSPHIPWWGTAVGIVLWLVLCTPWLVGIAHDLWVGKGGSLGMRLRRSCRSRKAWGATATRFHSHVEFYPTVHTNNLAIDLNVDALNTITDHVEFTTVGVRVPSLSQTTLLPVSPKTPRNKKTMDMRHKAILNHAYSNPQCNLSSGSLEKVGNRKKRGSGLSLHDSTDSMNGSFASKKSRRKGGGGPQCNNASTQTDKCCVAHRLQRQRSQPYVWVSRPVRVMARSLSWHSLRGQPAVLEVTSHVANSPDDDHDHVVNAGTTTLPQQQQQQQQQPPPHPGGSSVPGLTHEGQDRHGGSNNTTNTTSPCPLEPGIHHHHHQPRVQAAPSTLALKADGRHGLVATKRRRLGQSVAPNLGKLKPDSFVKHSREKDDEGEKPEQGRENGLRLMQPTRGGSYCSSCSCSISGNSSGGGNSSSGCSCVRECKGKGRASSSSSLPPTHAGAERERELTRTLLERPMAGEGESLSGFKELSSLEDLDPSRTDSNDIERWHESEKTKSLNFLDTMTTCLQHNDAMVSDACDTRSSLPALVDGKSVLVGVTALGTRADPRTGIDRHRPSTTRGTPPIPTIDVSDTSPATSGHATTSTAALLVPAADLGGKTDGQGQGRHPIFEVVQTPGAVASREAKSLRDRHVHEHELPSDHVHDRLQQAMHADKSRRLLLLRDGGGGGGMGTGNVIMEEEEDVDDNDEQEEMMFDAVGK